MGLEPHVSGDCNSKMFVSIVDGNRHSIEWQSGTICWGFIGESLLCRFGRVECYYPVLPVGFDGLEVLLERSLNFLKICWIVTDMKRAVVCEEKHFVFRDVAEPIQVHYSQQWPKNRPLRHPCREGAGRWRGVSHLNYLLPPFEIGFKPKKLRSSYSKFRFTFS